MTEADPRIAALNAMAASYMDRALAAEARLAACTCGAADANH